MYRGCLLKVVACGSALNAASYYDIEMAPEKAFSFGFIMHKLVVANKVKRHASSNDIFRYSEPISGIIFEISLKLQ